MIEHPPARRQIGVSSNERRLLVVVMAAALALGRGAEQRASELVGICGYVLGSDGVPAAAGTVELIAPIGGRIAATLGRDGRFCIVPNRSGTSDLLVAVPGYSAHRIVVQIPPSRALRLPVIRLAPPTFVRARFMTAGGTALSPQQVRRLSTGSQRNPLAEAGTQVVPLTTDADGVTTIGPLERGMTTLVVDTPPYAQKRLPEIRITGQDPLINLGNVILSRGAVVVVDVVDAFGAPVPPQEVFLDEVAAFPALSFQPLVTNTQGRVTFERVDGGEYEVRTKAAGPCGNRPLAASRPLTASGEGSSYVRLVNSGAADFVLTSPLGPLRGIPLSASPAAAAPRVPFPLRAIGALAAIRLDPLAFGCIGTSDAAGRAMLSVFPPGPAQLQLQFNNSTYTRRVTVPDHAAAIPIAVPDGFLSARVSDARTSQPIAGALITWTAGGGRTEAVASATGDALLEAVGREGGTLSIVAPGYTAHDEELAEPPGVLYEVALQPLPPTLVRARVMTSSDEPVAGAVIELALDDPMEPVRVAVADAAGVAALTDIPAGALHVSASAPGRESGTVRVPQDDRNGFILRLNPGYRVLLDVDFAGDSSLHQIRVLDSAGRSVDAALDVDSDRVLTTPGNVSLGPLAPGDYAVELTCAGRTHRHSLRIAADDVAVKIR